MSINLCDLCYELIVSACQDNYYLPTGLINGTDYTMSLEDLHGNVYTMTGSPTIDDEFIVTPNQFPDGMFNPYSGDYEITFTLNDELQELTINGAAYHCILMKIKDVTVI